MVFSSVAVFIFTIVLASLPIIEIRGAMPIGMSTTLWGEGALNSTMSMLASTLGGILACFVVVLVFFPLKKLLSRLTIFQRFFAYFDRAATLSLQKFEKKRKKMPKNSPPQPTSPSMTRKIEFNSPQIPQPKKDNLTLQKCAFVFFFCALPLPFTGVWSAGALASLLNMQFWPSVISLVLANVLSSLVVFGFCSLFQSYIDLVLIIMAIIFVLIAIYYSVAFLTKKLSKTNNSNFLE